MTKTRYILNPKNWFISGRIKRLDDDDVILSTLHFTFIKDLGDGILALLACNKSAIRWYWLLVCHTILVVAAYIYTDLIHYVVLALCLASLIVSTLTLHTLPLKMVSVLFKNAHLACLLRQYHREIDRRGLAAKYKEERQNYENQCDHP